jgi:hypothetical protein
MTKNTILEFPTNSFYSTGLLIITATSASSKHDLDFFEGNWKLQNRKLKSRLNNSDEWDKISLYTRNVSRS